MFSQFACYKMVLCATMSSRVNYIFFFTYNGLIYLFLVYFIGIRLKEKISSVFTDRIKCTRENEKVIAILHCAIS